MALELKSKYGNRFSYPRSYGRISIGDNVQWVGDSGFENGKLFHGTVEKIHVIDWDPKKAAELGVPVQEVMFEMTNGKLTNYCSPASDFSY